MSLLLEAPPGQQYIVVRLSVSLTWERRVVRLSLAIESLLADVSTPRSSAWTAVSSC